MGYNTEFVGELRFAKEATASQIAALSALCGEDARRHPEWSAPEGLSFIDLELTEDFGGLRWNGSEKTYGLDLAVDLILSRMRLRWPDFSFTGAISAIGEEPDDRWELSVGGDGRAQITEL